MSRSMHDPAVGRRRLAFAVRIAWAWAARTARLMVGLPDYQAYVDHVRAHHPGREPMAHEVFFSERLQARYGNGRSRCC